MLLWLCVCLLLSPASLQGKDTTLPHDLTVGGRARTYKLHVPPGLPPGAVPLVLVFHGGGGQGSGMERLTDFSEIADREGFLVAYPDGVGRSWNDGRVVPGRDSLQNGDVDDVAFAIAVIDDVGAGHSVNPKRVYATGMSNGAFFSHTLAARRADRIAAIAPVAGGISPQLAAHFHPSAPVAVLAINGTDDPLVPFAGGRVARSRGEAIPAEDALRLWVKADGCGPEPLKSELPDSDPQDGTRTRRVAYRGCRGDAEIVGLTVEGGGHTWPGGMQYLPEAFIGRTSFDFNATRLIWEFFASHPKP